MDETIFERWQAQVTPLDPVIADFCARYQYVLQTTALGRYPRRRLRKRNASVDYYIDLQMDSIPLDALNGQPSLTTSYSLGAGAWVDEGNQRYGEGFWCVQAIPFGELLSRIGTLLEEAHAKLAHITYESLKATGKRSTTRACSGGPGC